jgi:hypothetical protein
MNSQTPLPLWIISILNIVIQAAALVIAIIAVRRHAIKGLWILVLALLLSVALSIVELALVLMDVGMIFYKSLIFAPLIIAVITLCGWFVLAFCHKKVDRPDV